MAKQPDSSNPRKTGSHDEPEVITDAEVVEADAGESKKTKLAKKSPQPPAKKSASPTQLASGDPKDSGSPSRAPKTAPDDDEIIEAVAADSDVIEAQPASDVIEAQPASDAVEAQPASEISDVTPVQAEADDEIIDVIEMTEDVVGTERRGNSRTESSVRIKGKGQHNEMAERIEQPGDEIEPATAADDESSAVNLGGKLPKRKAGSHSGIDEVAEELESGVNLNSAIGPVSMRKAEPMFDLDDLVVEEPEKRVEPSSKAQKTKEATTDPEMLARRDAEEAAAAALLADDSKSADVVAADVGKETEELAVGAVEAEAPAPPSDKGIEQEVAAADDDESEAVAAAPARSTRRDAAAVATRPPRQAKHGRGMLVGMLAGILLTVVALIGLRYVDPDLLEPVFGSLPGTRQPKAAADLKTAQDSAKRARAEVDSARSEKDELEKNLEAKSVEIKKLNEQMATSAANDNAINELRDTLVKKKLISDKTGLKELGNVIGQTVAAKEQQDKLLQELTKTLVDAKLLTGNDKLDAAVVAKIINSMGDKQGAMAAINKLLDGAMIKESGEKGVQQLLNAKMNVEAKLTEINKLLGEAKVKGEGAAGLKEMVAQGKQLQKDRDDLDKTIADAHRELVAGKFIPDKGDPRQQLIEGIRAAQKRGESPLTAPLVQLAAKVGSLSLAPATDAKNAFEVAALLAEVNYYRLREPFVQSPEQRLDTYLSLYTRRAKSQGGDDAMALKEATWLVSKNSKAPAAVQAKAHAVRGLILRNQEKFGEAKEALQAAVAAAGPNAGPWAAQAKLALAELTDATAYYLPYIGELRGSGLTDLAKQELATALKAMPDDGRLLAQRALFQLEEARTTGKFAADQQAAVRKDAELAMKNPKTAAEGTFVLGLLEEELGNYGQAEQLFRQALKTHQGTADEAARYRIALARVLQRDRVPATTPAPKKEEKKSADAASAQPAGQAFPVIASLLIGQNRADGDAGPGVDARLNESVKLAQELIASANPKIKGQGYMLLGQALAKQGQRTEGIREYMKGLEMMFPGMASKEMVQLLNEHPLFQQPDVARAPNAYLAEVHFAKGLQLYWARKYAEAEDQFRQAAGFFGHDARYQYFLGLAQHAQDSKSKREAAILSFERGARLETDNRPSVDEVNSSLERVQGEQRKLINSFRAKAIELRN
jgi:hypothetical protein